MARRDGAAARDEQDEAEWIASEIESRLNEHDDPLNEQADRPDAPAKARGSPAPVLRTSPCPTIVGQARAQAQAQARAQAQAQARAQAQAQARA